MAGGNKSGKSVAGTTDLIKQLDGSHPVRKLKRKPVNMWLCCPNHDLQRDGIQDRLMKYMPKWMIDRRRGANIRLGIMGAYDRIELADGLGTITFKTYKADTDAFSAATVDHIHFDEEPPWRIFKECRARLVDSGGAWSAAITPVEGLTWSHEEIMVKSEQGKLPEVDVIRASMYDNVANIGLKEIREFEGELDDRERAIRIYGEYMGREGLVYDGIKPEVHFIPVLPQFKDGRGWEFVVGIDTGRWFCAEFLAYNPGPPPVAVFFAEVYGKDFTIAQNMQSVRANVEYYGIKPDYVVDATSQFKQDLVWAGCSAFDGPREIHASIDAFRDAMRIVEGRKVGINSGHPELFIGPACRKLRERMLTYRWDTYASKGKHADIPKANPAPGDNHAVDAARYALWFTRRPPDIPTDKPKPLTEHQQILQYIRSREGSRDVPGMNPWLGNLP